MAQLAQTSALTRIIERTMGLPSAQPTAIPVAAKPGYVKVRLTFLTDEPKHYRSYQLSAMYGFQKPFTEEAYVLVPSRHIVGMELTTFCPAFAFLQRNFVISRTARLVGAALVDEDTDTLAYICR